MPENIRVKIYSKYIYNRRSFLNIYRENFTVLNIQKVQTVFSDAWGRLFVYVLMGTRAAFSLSLSRCVWFVEVLNVSQLLRSNYLWPLSCQTKWNTAAVAIATAIATSAFCFSGSCSKEIIFISTFLENLMAEMVNGAKKRPTCWEWEDDGSIESLNQSICIQIQSKDKWNANSRFFKLSWLILDPVDTIQNKLAPWNGIHILILIHHNFSPLWLHPRTRLMFFSPNYFWCPVPAQTQRIVSDSVSHILCNVYIGWYLFDGTLTKSFVHFLRKVIQWFSAAAAAAIPSSMQLLLFKANHFVELSQPWRAFNCVSKQF